MVQTANLNKEDKLKTNTMYRQKHVVPQVKKSSPSPNRIREANRSKSPAQKQHVAVKPITVRIFQIPDQL